MTLANVFKLIDETNRIWAAPEPEKMLEFGFSFPGDPCNGSIYCINCSSWIKIEMASFCFSMDVTQQIDTKEPPMLRFTYSLPSNGSVLWIDARGDKAVDESFGRCAIKYYPELKGVMEFSSGLNLYKVSIGMDPARLHNYLGEEFAGIPGGLRKIADAGQGGDYSLESAMNKFNMQSNCFAMILKIPPDFLSWPKGSDCPTPN